MEIIVSYFWRIIVSNYIVEFLSRYLRVLKLRGEIMNILMNTLSPEAVPWRRTNIIATFISFIRGCNTHMGCLFLLGSWSVACFARSFSDVKVLLLNRWYWRSVSPLLSRFWFCVGDSIKVRLEKLWNPTLQVNRSKAIKRVRKRV